MPRKSNQRGSNLQVRRGELKSLDIYEVTDVELQRLCEASPGSVYQNFSILFVSVATSFLVGLLTVDIESNRIFTVFVILVVVGYVAGAILLVLWWQNRRSVSETAEKVKKRMPTNVENSGDAVTVENDTK